MEQQPRSIFISHSTKDDAQVDRIAAALESAGFAVWVDHRAGIAPGTPSWDRAIRKALAQRELPQPTSLIQHTDRGSQYTADDYPALLKTYDIQVSMSGKDASYDNAIMASFFRTLRVELTDLERFAARQAVRTAVFEFIGMSEAPGTPVLDLGADVFQYPQAGRYE